ncbi:putative transcriptional regulator [Microbacterium testaceum]|uniref:hypothetical protein n=1 Tax=Microbacterium TaxID=33882 RepID=UPI00278B98BD|nr:MULTISPECIES: hypothetical protein [Microbacterium]MDQ1111138.1 putative transcriptional regulator [Microbacterium testaceum]MDR6098323.1 putative transcriptional regulator [Microbacterium sp. SORGH_AS_0454]
MADPSPSREGLAQIADEINALWRAVGELKAPSGTQQANAVAQLEAAVADLQAQQAQIVAQQEQITILVSDLDERITDFINENIDDIVAAQVTAALASADITIGQSGGVVRLPSIITTDLTSASGRVVTWTAGDGRIGHT